MPLPHCFFSFLYVLNKVVDPTDVFPQTHKLKHKHVHVHVHESCCSKQIIITELLLTLGPDKMARLSHNLLTLNRRQVHQKQHTELGFFNPNLRFMLASLSLTTNLLVVCWLTLVCCLCCPSNSPRSTIKYFFGLKQAKLCSDSWEITDKLWCSSFTLMIKHLKQYLTPKFARFLAVRLSMMMPLPSVTRNCEQLVSCPKTNASTISEPEMIGRANTKVYLVVKQHFRFYLPLPQACESFIFR